MCTGVDSASEKWIPGISPGVKAAGAYGWRPTTLVVTNVKKIRGLDRPGTAWACSGLLRDDLYLYCNVQYVLSGNVRLVNLLCVWVRFSIELPIASKRKEKKRKIYIYIVVLQEIIVTVTGFLDETPCSTASHPRRQHLSSFPLESRTSRITRDIELVCLHCIRKACLLTGVASIITPHYQSQYVTLSECVHLQFREV